MVCHDTHGHVAAGVVPVTFARHPGYLPDKRLEHIGIVIALLALHYHTEPFKPHTGIDMTVRKLFQGTVGLAVVLHEDEIPYLDDLRMVAVHQLPSGFRGTLFVRTQVEMNLAAGTAGPRIAHLPEIILFIAAQNPLFGKETFPIRIRLAVERHTVLLASFEYRRIEPVFGQPVHLRQQPPRPLDSLFLEIVAERPVAEHLEHGVMIGIMPHFIEVVVLARYAKTLLRIRHTGVFGRAVAEENILELVHAGVGEHQRRVVLYDHRCRRHDGMLLASEKIQKGLPYPVRFHSLVDILFRLSVTLFFQVVRREADAPHMR